MGVARAGMDAGTGRSKKLESNARTNGPTRLMLDWQKLRNHLNKCGANSRGKSGVIGHGPQRDWQSQETAIPNGNQSCGEPQDLAQTGGSKGGAKARAKAGKAPSFAGGL